MCKYMDQHHPDAFLDYPPVVIPEDMDIADAVLRLCPNCKGRGGWNLKLNAYQLPEGRENTPENRHRWVHFRCGCTSCNGWGYLAKGQTCAHEWTIGRNLGRCLNEYICTLCGAITEVDSSD